MGNKCSCVRSGAEKAPEQPANELDTLIDKPDERPVRRPEDKPILDNVVDDNNLEAGVDLDAHETSAVVHGNGVDRPENTPVNKPVPETGKPDSGIATPDNKPQDTNEATDTIMDRGSRRRASTRGEGRRQQPQVPPNRHRGGSRRNRPGVTTRNDEGPDPSVLTVEKVDLNITENSKAHKTHRYEISYPWERERKLVVRRGQAFTIDIDFSRPYDNKKDDLKLIFEIGDQPNSSKGTYVEFILSDVDKPKEWGAKISYSAGSQLTIQVFTPPTLPVGKWDFSIDVVKKRDTDVEVYSYEHEDPIYIIFNPWCKDDEVYLNDEELLKEYILNESGKIYSGSASNITSKPWNFGQFESPVLDCAIYLLDESNLNWAVRGKPVNVVRKISAMVNSSDDDGVLTGNWSGDYKGGRSPLSWTGSVAILEKYWQTKQPVEFGQCWVFSGVCTTVCRALGIPARSVTNFASAHDTDGSVTIDAHYTSEGERDESLNDDSVWNFHVWNEAWMARTDLPKGFGGWQAFDATPQEASDDVYCCGPVSVQAIKQGEINLPYDGAFVFAEVNADRMYWVPKTGVFGQFDCVHCDKNAVGKFISTKKPNSFERLDVTNNYKPAEGSAEERAAVLKANQVGSTRHDLYQKTNKDVTFDVKQDSANTWLGGDFQAALTMRNDSKSSRTISGRLVVSPMYYTGVVAKKLKSQPFEKITLKPGEELERMVQLSFKEYDGNLLDGAMLDLSVWSIVAETNQQFTTKRDFRLRKPHLTIKAPKGTKAGEEFFVDVSFANPLDCQLTNCSLSVDGLSKHMEFPQGNVSPKGTFNTRIPITPKKTGDLELILSFNCTQLFDVNGSSPITIHEK